MHSSECFSTSVVFFIGISYTWKLVIEVVEIPTEVMLRQSARCSIFGLFPSPHQANPTGDTGIRLSMMAKKPVDGKLSEHWYGEKIPSVSFFLCCLYDHILISIYSTILLIGAVRSALTSASRCLRTHNNLLQNTAFRFLRCGEHLRQCSHGLLLCSPSNLFISCCWLSVCSSSWRGLTCWKGAC